MPKTYEVMDALSRWACVVGVLALPVAGCSDAGGGAAGGSGDGGSAGGGETCGQAGDRDSKGHGDSGCGCDTE
jgi:hypothetical protein